MEHFEKLQRLDKEYIHSQLGVEAAKIQGIFPDDEMKWSIAKDEEIKVAHEDSLDVLHNWQHQLDQILEIVNNKDFNLTENPQLRPAQVLPISDLSHDIESPESMSTIEETDMLAPCEIASLNDDQRRAYDILDWHMKETIAGKIPPQLLMVIPGEGGVGKSMLIQTITKKFRQRHIRSWLVKGAYTGVAASLIDGKTLHVLGGIPVQGGKQSSQQAKKLREFWRTKQYLIIDKISMLA